MIRAMSSSTGAKTTEMSDVQKERTYRIMTMNMNGKGSADERRKQIISTIKCFPASVIFCQELPGDFDTEVVENCGNSYKFVRPVDCYSSQADVAVMWRETEFQGKEVNLKDGFLFTEIVKGLLIKEENLDVGMIMGSIRAAMVKLTSCRTGASFLAVSWHGPRKVNFKNSCKLDSKARKDFKLKVLCNLIRLLQVVCEKENLSSFIIGGDFNLNFDTSDVVRLAEYGVRTPHYSSGAPGNDTFIFSIPSDKLPMTVDITVSSIESLKLEHESGQSALLDHDRVVGNLEVVCTYKKPSIKQDGGKLEQ